MKRYRVLGLGFDSRPWMLAEEIRDSWEPHVRAQWQENRRKLLEALATEYGRHRFEEKIQNFIDFGRIPFSVFAFHNQFVAEIQRAFVVGSYYPALTGACALGERILNHLIIALRENFRGTRQFKRIHSKESFDNWDLAIETLEAWNVLVPDSSEAFRKLRHIRGRAIHFRPEVDRGARPMALDASHSLLKIVGTQFGVDGRKSWFMRATPGEIYIAKQAESLPFIRSVYLPNCRLVGPRHTTDRAENGALVIRDDHTYEDREITDDEFRVLRREATSTKATMAAEE